MASIPPLNPSTFFEQVFETISSTQVYKDPLKDLVCNEQGAICQNFDLTKIQESWSWRNVYFARELALMLIDENGKIKRPLLFKAIGLLEQNLHSLGSGRYHDASRLEHVLNILRLFYSSKEYPNALNRLSAPQGHDIANRLIRATLFLKDSIRLTDAHAKQAAFAALLTILRQNVGSCFATAPAILIQQDQPLQFLADIGQLLGTGRLTRVVEGVEYTVPLSVSWGMGDLYRPFLMTSLGTDPFKTLARSPGLHEAFRAAELCEEMDSIEPLLKKSSLKTDDESFFSYTTADQMIQSVLLDAFSLTEQDVIEFKERPAQPMMGALTIQVPVPLGKKSLACSRYLKAYEAAVTAFKALTDNALLKAWEFTLASLSESKADFAKWNLYASLGVQPEEPGGIGQSIYQMIQEKIQLINDELEDFQSRYDHLFAQVKSLEGRMTRASSDRDAEWIRAEYQMRKHEINRVLSERDELHDKGTKLQQLYPKLIDFYGIKIREYFQEVYDAEMLDVSANIYDDSPAGFRLVYKHGRSNTALWSMIHSAREYLEHLTSFFVSTEIELRQLEELEGLQKELSDVISTAITTIKRPEFLESSIFRLARAYNEPVISDPVENLEKVKRKPWSYISGGTMGTLVNYYWGGTKLPDEEKRWVENETELLAFLLDTLKELPLSVQKLYQKDSNKTMLCFSPTHAFLAKPGWSLFRKGWESDAYTYTWIRDMWTFPQQRFLDTCVLDHRMIEKIIEQLLFFIPNGYREVVRHALNRLTYSMSPPELRENVIKALSYEKWLKEGNRLNLICEELDSILYRSLPLFPEHQLQQRLTTLFDQIDEIDPALKAKLFQTTEHAIESMSKYQILTAQDLLNSAKGLLMYCLKTSRSSIFYHQKILQAMQKTGLAYPEPILFADTNWVKNVFGFIVNPGTSQVEFWRFDECGTEGRPISVWKKYLNGSVQQTWGLYTHPHQYGV